MPCRFMENSGRKMNPGCGNCTTYYILCRNHESPVFRGTLLSRHCSQARCKFYKEKDNDLLEVQVRSPE